MGELQSSLTGHAEFVICDCAIEVTFHEVRAHLGVETQRQWSDLAIVRTTPALLGLFSLVTIFAHHFVGWPSVSCSTGGLVYQSLADLFRYARLRVPASLAFHLFFGLVTARRHRSNSTSPFRSLRGYARFCCLMTINRLKHLDKVYLRSSRYV